MVHSGFQVAYLLVRREIMAYLHGLHAEYVPVETVYFIGHSLGGALAHFCFLDCQVRSTPCHAICHYCTMKSWSNIVVSS